MVRGKHPLWNHVDELDNQRFRCKFCKRDFAGGIPRIRAHLSCITGRGIDVCKEVPDDVRAFAISEIGQPSKKARTATTSVDIRGNSASASSTKHLSGTVQQNVMPAMHGNDRTVADKNLARFLLYRNIPSDVLEAPCFSDFIRSVVACGRDYKLPSSSMLETTIFPDIKTEVETHVRNVKESWMDSGCTVLVEVLHNSITIIAYSVKGAVFIKSFDSISEKSDFDIKDTVSSVIEDIGYDNVVQLITNDDRVFCSVRDMLGDRYPRIYMTRCVAHEIHLLLKNIYDIVCWVKLVDERAWNDLSSDKDGIPEGLGIHNGIQALLHRVEVETNNCNLKPTETSQQKDDGRSRVDSTDKASGLPSRKENDEAEELGDEPDQQLASNLNSQRAVISSGTFGSLSSFIRVDNCAIWSTGQDKAHNSNEWEAAVFGDTDSIHNAPVDRLRVNWKGSPIAFSDSSGSKLRENYNCPTFPLNLPVSAAASSSGSVSVTQYQVWKRPRTGDPACQWTEIVDPGECRLVTLPDATKTTSKVVRLLYTNSGEGILSLQSNGAQNLWKWPCNDQNPRGKVTASAIPQHWQSYNDILGVNLEEAVPCMALSKNDSYVMSAAGGKVSQFNISTFKVMTTFMPSPPASTFLALPPQDNNIIAIGMEDSRIRIYNVRNDELTATLKGHQKRITGLVFSSYLNILVSSGADAQLCMWSAYTWEKIKSVTIQIPAGMTPTTNDTQVQFHSNQTRLLVVHETHLAVYDASSVHDASSKMDRVCQWIPGDELPAPITCATYSCNSQLIYATFSDGNIGVFDGDTLRLRCRIASSAYMSQEVLNGSHNVHPLVVAAHPMEPNQLAIGLTNGCVIVMEPTESEGKWGSPPPFDDGLLDGVTTLSTSTSYHTSDGHSRTRRSLFRSSTLMVGHSLPGPDAEGDKGKGISEYLHTPSSSP